MNATRGAASGAVAPPNAWRQAMARLLEAIDATKTEGDRESLWEEYEVCRLNAITTEAEAETARRLIADAEAELTRLTSDGWS